MTQWRLLVVVVVVAGTAGCPRSSPPRVAPPAAPACITPPDEAAEIMHASGDATHVQFCVGAAAAACFALDLATGALTSASAPVVPPGADAELKACAGSECAALASQPSAGPRHPRVATRAPYEIVLLGDAAAGKGYAEAWDTSASTKLASFRYAHGEFRCGDVALLGETIYVGANTCTGPAGRGTLYTLQGKKIASVGEKDFGTFGNAFVHVEGAVWAFLDENATKLVLQDVTTGKLQKTIDVTRLWRREDAGSGDSAPIGNPGESEIVKLDSGRLAVIGGTPANGSVAIVDVANGDVKIVRAPMCH